MPIPAGAYDRLCQLWRKVSGVDNDLGEDLTPPQKIADLWASVSAKAALERNGIARTEAVRTEVFTVRFSTVTAAVSPADHVVIYEGRTYNINSKTEVGYKEAFDIVAEARADNG